MIYNSVDLEALGWLKPSIDEHIKLAQACVESLVGNPTDASSIKGAVDNLSSIQIPIEVVGVNSVGNLISEIGRSLRSLLEEKSEPNQELIVLSILNAVLVLPNYLSLLHTGVHEEPAILMSVISEMRHARKEKPLLIGEYISNTFMLDINKIQFARTRRSVEDLRLLALKARNNYQKGLIPYIKENKTSGLVAMMRSAQAMKVYSEQEGNSSFWAISESVMASLINAKTTLIQEAKLLLAHVDKALRYVSLNGENGLIEELSPDFIKGMAYIIATSDDDNDSLTIVRESDHFTKIVGALKEVQKLASLLKGDESNLLDSVSKEVSLDLKEIVSEIDIYVRAKDKNMEIIAQTPSRIKMMTGAMDLVGMGKESELLLEIASYLDQSFDAGEEIPEEKLQSIADSLVVVEDGVNRLSERKLFIDNVDYSEIIDRGVITAVVVESLKTISKIKHEFVLSTSRDSSQGFASIISDLSNVGRYLSAASLGKASNIIFTICYYISANVVDKESVISESAAYNLACSISGVEAFLEAIKNTDRVSFKPLYHADIAINNLNIEVSEKSLENFINGLASDKAQVTTANNDAIEKLGSQSVPANEPVEESVEKKPGTDNVDYSHLINREVVLLELSEYSFEKGVDVDIAEIFVEEVVDNIQIIMNEFSSLVSKNIESIKTARRAYHTLKGSGRMTGADRLGEFAWSLENALNRVLDETVDLSPLLVEQVAKSVPFVKELVNEFCGSEKASDDVEIALGIANAIASGEKTEDISAEFERLPHTEIVVSKEVAGQLENNSSVSEVEVSDIDDVDPVLRKIFINETLKCQSIAKETISDWNSVRLAASSDEHLNEIIRSIHTIKGSAKTAGADDISYIFKSFETEFMRFENTDKLIPVDVVSLLLESFELAAASLNTDDSFGVIENKEGILNRLSVAIKNASSNTVEVEKYSTNSSEVDVEIVAEAGEIDYDIEVSELQSLEVIDIEDQGLTESVTLQENATTIEGGESDSVEVNPATNDVGSEAIIETEDHETETLELGALIEEIEINDVSAESIDDSDLIELPQPIEIYYKDLNIGEDIVEIFMEESQDLIQVIDDHLSCLLPGENNADSIAELQRAMHTLKGSANMCGAKPVGDLTHVLETLFEKVSEGAITLDEGIISVILASHDKVQDFIELLNDKSSVSGSESIISHINLILDAKKFVEVKKKDVEPQELDEPISSTGDLVINPPVDQGFVVDVVENNNQNQSSPLTDLIELDFLSEKVNDSTRNKNTENSVKPQVDYDVSLFAELFEEEASEITTDLDFRLKALTENPSDVDTLKLCQRYAHTIKGGSSLIELTPISALADKMESLFSCALELNLATDKDFTKLAYKALDSLNDMLSLAKESKEVYYDSKCEKLCHEYCASKYAENTENASPQEDQPSTESVKSYEPGSSSHDDHVVTLNKKEDTIDEPVDSLEVTSDANCEAGEDIDNSFTDDAKPNPKEDQKNITLNKVRDKGSKTSTHELIESLLSERTSANADRRSGNRKDIEQVRVRTDVISSIANVSSELVISRSNVEQKHIKQKQFFDQITGVLDKLNNNIRKLSIKSEAQINARRKELQEANDDFDPLEMDSFSDIQTLTKGMDESVADMSDIINMQNGIFMEMDALLSLEGRLHVTLQSDLVKARTLPFSHHIPRLRRLVRQASGDIEKEVEIRFQGSEEELDRSILDRLMPQLEHLLRNSVDHGIECPEDRIVFGKPEKGLINIEVKRLGQEAIITISDDGAGINLEAVKKKAIENGLLNKGAIVTDDELVNFILHAGFSTAKELTQISGRGVGMDSVNSEVRMMGGRLEIQTMKNKGTISSIILPLMMSISKALLVSINGKSYAIPVSTIEAVEYVPPETLTKMYSNSSLGYEFNKQTYNFVYLGEMIGAGSPNNIRDEEKAPLILTKSGGSRFAVHVDKIISNSEIVTKPLPEQFNNISIGSSATILGDGEVAIIIDIPSVIKGIGDSGDAAALKLEVDRAKAKAKGVQAKTVMVVDDSITIRKVSERFLKKSNYSVALAKDGVDALEKLHAGIMPDIMLLDIEMPRMDGFELAQTMMNDPELSLIPIIMITSRTGEKHKNKAKKLGVKRYLGKPFIEEDLTSCIKELLAEETSGI